MKNSFLRSQLPVITVFALIVSCSVLYWTGCSDKQDAANPVTTPQQSLAKMSTADPAVRSVMTIQERHTADLMANKNVVGTATGRTDDGRLAVIVYLKEPIGN